MDENLKNTNFKIENNAKKIERENSLIEPIVKNPFIYKLKIDLIDKVKLCIGGIFLLPIRLVAISIICFVAIIIGILMTIGLDEQVLKEKPLSGWRRNLRSAIRFLGRAIAFCFGFHKIKKNGQRAFRSDCTIFVAAPHSSFFDTFVFFILGLPSGVSRSENGDLPLIGRVIKAVQPILVTREDSKNKLSTIEEIKKRADPNSDWPQVLVFPEGTTTNRSCLISFKQGAFIPRLPVQPVIVEYKNRIDTITWTWQGLSAYKVTFLTLCQFNNKMEITYLPVYYPNAEELENANLYALNVRNLMADRLNLSRTYHTYEDCRLMCRARELNLPFESAIIEFSKLKEKLGINYNNCKDLLDKYAGFARKNDGKMSLREFCQYLDLPATPIVEFVFDSYDRNKDGHIDFREFVIGLSLLSRPENTQDNMKLAFEMFDKDGKNHISLNDLQSILYSSFSMPYEETKNLFEKIDTQKDNLITYTEFHSYATQKPEYAKIFSVLNELKILKGNIEIENLSKHSSTISDKKESEKLFKIVSSDSSVSLTKRPLSDRARSSSSKEIIKSDITIEDLNIAYPAKYTEEKNE